MEGDEVLEKMKVVRDFGNFVIRARRRNFGENVGGGGFWDFCKQSKEKEILEKTRVAGDFGNFGDFVK